MTPRELRCITRDMKTHRYTPTPPMPTTRHRVQVMLEPEQFEAVRDLAAATRLSMSRICADIITEATPLLNRAAAMTVAAASLTDEARALLKPGLERTEDQLIGNAARAYAALADTEAAIKRASRASGGGEARARGRVATPPPRRSRPR